MPQCKAACLTPAAMVVALMITGGTSPANAQAPGYAQPPPVVIVDRPPPKDPTTATILSLLIPGGGHLYAKETGTGAFLAIGGTGALTVGYVVTLMRLDESCPVEGDHCEIDFTPVMIGASIWAAAWLYGIIDGASAAKRYNARWRQQHPSRTSPMVTPYAAHTPHGTNYGMQLNWSF